MKKTLLLLITLLFVFYSSAQIQYIKAFEQIHRKGEVYFKFNMPDGETIAEITNIISIDNVENGKITAYANNKEFQKFLGLGIEFEVYEHPGDRLKNPQMYDGSKGIWDFDTYPTYSEFETMMYSFQTDFPGICKIYQIGTTVDGRKLLIAKISNNVNTKEAEPKFMYTSSMHGDETTGYVLLLRLIDYLLNNYGTNATVNNLVNSMEIWIMPLENPDGTYAGGDNTVTGSTRNNGNNVDLNRNYQNFVAGDHPDGEVWQPEVLAMMGLSDTVHFNVSANFHGGTEVINYPWDSKAEFHADDAWWQYVARAYADVVHANAPSDYLEGYEDGITNGYAWYQALGSRQDYFTYDRFGREFTIEVSDVKTVDESELVNHWNYNYQSMLNYMLEAKYGIHGIVTDSITHEPLAATVFIDGFDFDNSHTFSYLPHGDYHRPICEGTYNVTYSSPGYRSKTLEVTAVNGQTTIQDVELANLEFLPPFTNFTANKQIISCQGPIQFTNLTESYGTTNYTWNFGDGTISTEENPVHAYTANGVYSVSLYAQNINGDDSIVRTSYIQVSLPQLTEVNSAVVCDDGGSLELSAYGSGEIFWYDQPFGGSSIYTGNVFTTPFLTESFTYYAESHNDALPAYVGKTNNDGSGGYYDNNSQWGLVFDCFSEATLLSVKVYTGSTADRTIYLKSSSGTVLQQITVNIPEGESRVDLNFNLPVGENLELTCSSNPDMYRNNNGAASFPYILEDILSIKKSNLPDIYGPEDFYYFFYEWEVVGQSCISERTPVFAVINEPAIAEFNYFVNSGGNVSFYNNSINATSYSWDFGDGTGFSTAFQPNYTYLSDGTYEVSLIAQNECGSDTTSYEVIISGLSAENTLTENFIIFPNPVSSFMNINFESEKTGIIEITDISGRKVFEEKFNGNSFTGDISFLVKGMYLLKIKTEESTIIKQVIKN
ncbi:MAG: PKD domain-containing protein [Bacteroidales bacterium]|nr:PKD domain-containing protein [Bacteroidales bacterium]